MKLKIYDSTKHSRKHKASLNFAPNGLITISSGAMRQLGFSIGDKVLICQDEDEPGDWYIGKHEVGVAIRAAYTDKSEVIRGIFNHTPAVRDIAKHVGQEEKSFTLLVGTTSTEANDMILFPILTSSYKPTSK